MQRLFHEMTSYVQNIRIEVVVNGRGLWSQEEHPATTIGPTLQKPVVRIVDSLDKGQRIEAIAHELAHLLLVYRDGLGVVGRRIPRHGDSGDVFRFFMSMRGDWVYLLGQIANTVHHLILVDNLKKEYGIESSLHLRLLHHNFGIIANENVKDKESHSARGLIAFEYEKLIGKVDKVINIFCQTESFWQAYHSAQKHFGRYGFQSIPTSSSYEENILSFLEALGYQREDFMFLPEKK
ncbi:MAG: hypothetical protein LUQ22_07430 [Methanotrichaceae archaeon]|nr:hypothetical protein [Methanotrichaceae archaeon]